MSQLLLNSDWKTRYFHATNLAMRNSSGTLYALRRDEMGFLLGAKDIKGAWYECDDLDIFKELRRDAACIKMGLKENLVFEGEGFQNIALSAFSFNTSGLDNVLIGYSAGAYSRED